MNEVFEKHGTINFRWFEWSKG